MNGEGKKRSSDCLQSDLCNVAHRVKSAYGTQAEKPRNNGEPDEGRSDFAQRGKKIFVGQRIQLRLRAAQRTGRSAAWHRPPTVAEAPKFNARLYQRSI